MLWFMYNIFIFQLVVLVLRERIELSTSPLPGSALPLNQGSALPLSYRSSRPERFSNSGARAFDNEGGSAVVERTDSGKGTALSALSNNPMELPCANSATPHGRNNA
jgi:hypothetical protein